MAFLWTQSSLFAEGPTAEHIEYALPTPGSLPTSTTTTTTTYHHIQHFLPDGTPGASSTHIEYADDPAFTEPAIPVFNRRRPTTTTTVTSTAQLASTRGRGPPAPLSPSSSTSTSTSTSTSFPPSTSTSSQSPPLHVHFAGVLPLPLPPSHHHAPSTTTSSTSPSPSQPTRSRPPTTPQPSRSRPSSPYPLRREGVHALGVEPNVFAEEFGRAVGEEQEGMEGWGEELVRTVARTAVGGLEEGWEWVSRGGGGVMGW